jgi:hypothetical protein
MRNLSNKVTFAKELLGLSKKTPMAIFLQEIGLEVDLNTSEKNQNKPFFHAFILKCLKSIFLTSARVEKDARVPPRPPSTGTRDKTAIFGHSEKKDVKKTTLFSRNK